MHLSGDQLEALRAVTKWHADAPEPAFDYKDAGGAGGSADKGPQKITIGFAHDYPVLSLGGYAGTGKTTVLKNVGLSIQNVRFVTPTHKAAQVLRSKLPEEMQRKVVTFHSLIYTPNPKYSCELSGLEMEALDAECGCAAGDFCDHAPVFQPCMRHVAGNGSGDGSQPDRECKPVEHLTFQKRGYLASWSSVIVVDEASMLTEDEVNDIRSFGVPVLLVGDHGQLSPVKARMNPWIEHPQLVLTVNHRQGETSGIPSAADEAREHGVLRNARYGSSVSCISQGNEKVPGLLERFRPDAKSRTVIVQYNRTRAALNSAFHEQHGPDVINPGERLIALQRLEGVVILDPRTGDAVGETFVLNGTMATVKRVDQIRPRTATCVLELDNDWKGAKGVNVLVNLSTEQLGAEQKLSLDRKPRNAVLWDYAYALTCHKAQGSEFDQVIVMHEGGTDRRWLYTAVTRAKEGLIVLTA